MRFIIPFIALFITTNTYAQDKVIPTQPGVQDAQVVASLIERINLDQLPSLDDRSVIQVQPWDKDRVSRIQAKLDATSVIQFNNDAMVVAQAFGTIGLDRLPSSVENQPKLDVEITVASVD